MLLPLAGLRAELPWTKSLMDYVYPSWCPRKPSRIFERLTCHGRDAVRPTRLAQRGSNKTLFSKMVMEEEERQGVPNIVIEKEVSKVIIAGTDTTAVTLKHLTCAIIGDQNVKRKVVQELRGYNSSPK
ncbi:hypothetical protein EJ02DRAFT_464853 [Clathrospora elynae]|uniref:Uncharacterized protein n=1 Tax=Clathrospora elynae TaxID=706981 RepID=A0A6A5SW21_9PLEO|nr:hypothetical protein EJ02DRAFT_464853 [Clathrospora elynae]